MSRENEKRDMVIYVPSRVMGEGDDNLGAELLSKFLDTLSQFQREISHLVFVNAGARLVAEGSPVLDQLRHLQGVGVDILACGTCLSHFGIKDRVEVGRVSNMVEIIETLSRARRVLRP